MPAEFGQLKGRKYEIAPWTGDDFRRGHQLRDAAVPAASLADEKHVDFVIVGGGLAGLTAAHYLKDSDFLLLEQYDDLGGQSRGGSHRGLNYSYGAAIIGAPDGDIAALLSDLSLKPVKFDTARNSWHAGERSLVGIEGVGASKQDGLYKDFKRFQQEAKPIWQSIAKETQGALIKNSGLQKLDETLFASCLSGYSPEFLSLIDRISKSYNCLGLDKISALAGYELMEDTFVPCFAFEGGNSAITNALALKLKSPRLQRGTFVWSVAVTESGASVIYSDDQGHVHLVHAKHAIVTTPLLVAARIIKNMDNASKAQMLQFKYGSYLVANCLLSKSAYDGNFDNWYTDAFSFSDIMIAESVYKKRGKYTADMGQALTVYQAYPPGSEGRSVLLEGDRIKLSSEIINQLSTISDKLEASLDSIVLSRWGHAMPVSNLGYYSRMNKVAAISSPSFSLAHSSIQGMPCAESAVGAAKKAADQALKIKPQTKKIVSTTSR